MLISGVEGSLIERIRAADGDAAAPLYDRFAAGLRVLLRHKLHLADLDTGVFFVLIAVARAVREGKIQDESQLPAQVRIAANTFIEEAKSTHGSAPPDSVDDIRRTLRQLETAEQEILTRFYHLAQTEENISREMRIAVESVREVKKNARKRFRAQK